MPIALLLACLTQLWHTRSLACEVVGPLHHHSQTNTVLSTAAAKSTIRKMHATYSLTGDYISMARELVRSSTDDFMTADDNNAMWDQMQERLMDLQIHS